MSEFLVESLAHNPDSFVADESQDLEDCYSTESFFVVSKTNNSGIFSCPVVKHDIQVVDGRCIEVKCSDHKSNIL